MQIKKYAIITLLVVSVFGIATEARADFVQNTGITPVSLVGGGAGQKDIQFPGTTTIQYLKLWPDTSTSNFINFGCTGTGVGGVVDGNLGTEGRRIFFGRALNSDPYASGEIVWTAYASTTESDGSCLFQASNGSATTTLTVNGTDLYAMVINIASGVPHNYPFLGTPTSVSSVYGSANNINGSSPFDWLGTNSAIVSYRYAIGYTIPNPSPVGDGKNHSHVITVIQPSLYATTTNTFDVEFDAIIGATSTPDNAYHITYVNDLTRSFTEQYGYLGDAGYTGGNNPFRIATTSTLSQDGTYTMSVSLGIGSSNGVEGGSYTNEPIDNFQPDTGSFYDGWKFSVNVSDNTTVVEFGGLVQSTYASTTCQINFLGTFDLNGCVNYLLTPTPETMMKFKSLTLANSAPFSYAYQLGTLTNLLFTSATSPNATSSVSVTVGDGPNAWNITFISKAMLQASPLAAPVKAIITSLLFFMMALAVYHKVIKVHDNQTPK